MEVPWSLKGDLLGRLPQGECKICNRHSPATDTFLQYPNQVWKVPTFSGWIVIANGSQRVEDMSKASEEYLNTSDHFAEVRLCRHPYDSFRLNSFSLPSKFLQLDYTLGPEVTWNPYHVNVIRTSLTRNILAQFDDMYHEMVDAFDEALPREMSSGKPSPSVTIKFQSPTSVSEWNSVPILDATVELTSRVSARLAVGAPLCEFVILTCKKEKVQLNLSVGYDKEYRAICNRSGTSLMKGRVLRFFPRFLKP